MIIILSLLILLQFRFFDIGLPRLGRSWSLCPYAYLMCIISLSWRKIAKSLIYVVTNGSKFRSAFLATLYLVLNVFYCWAPPSNFCCLCSVYATVEWTKLTPYMRTWLEETLVFRKSQLPLSHTRVISFLQVSSNISTTTTYCINLECMHMQCTYIYSCELHELLLILHAPQAWAEKVYKYSSVFWAKHQFQLNKSTHNINKPTCFPNRPPSSLPWPLLPMLLTCLSLMHLHPTTQPQFTLHQFPTLLPMVMRSHPSHTHLSMVSLMSTLV